MERRDLQIGGFEPMFGVILSKIHISDPYHPSLGTLTTSNPGFQAIGSWARYLGLGTLGSVTPSNPGYQAIGY